MMTPMATGTNTPRWKDHPIRPSPSSTTSWWQSATLYKVAGILSTVLLLWINVSMRPDNSAMLFSDQAMAESALSMPRKLDVKNDILRKDRKTRQQLPIVTFVDHRIADPSATKPPNNNNNNNNNNDDRHSPTNNNGDNNQRKKNSRQNKNNQNNPPYPKQATAKPQSDQHTVAIVTRKSNKPRRQKTLSEWRETYNQACEQGSNISLMDLLVDIVQPIYQPGPTEDDDIQKKKKKPKKKNGRNNVKHIQPCQYTFLDLGANIGDSLGKFIDSSLDNCDLPQHGIRNLSPMYNLETGMMNHFHDKENALVRYSRHVTRKAGRLPRDSPPRYPEQYCYVGLEGNPVFTERLQALQERVNGASPRPVRHAKFLTETVAAGLDGPTVMYLDTVSTAKNYWGSSLLSQPKYVRESADKYNGGKPIEAPVTGVTLSTLVQRTVLPQKNAHLLIKMDIEGGEYAVLQEAYESGVICDYVQNKGVIITMLLEKHTPQFQAANLDMAAWDTFTKGLVDCGVIIQGGMNAG